MRLRMIKVEAGHKVTRLPVKFRNFFWARYNKRCRQDWGVTFSYSILIQFNDLRSGNVRWAANTICAPVQMSAHQRLLSIVREVVGIAQQQCGDLLPIDYTAYPLTGASVVVTSYQSEYNRV